MNKSNFNYILQNQWQPSLIKCAPMYAEENSIRHKPQYHKPLRYTCYPEVLYNFLLIHYLLILQRRTWADCMLTGSHLFGCDLYEWQLCPVPFCTQTLAEQLTLTGVLVFSTFSFPSRSLELFFVDVERSLSLLSPMWSRSFSLFLSFLFRLW